MSHHIQCLLLGGIRYTVKSSASVPENRKFDLISMWITGHGARFVPVSERGRRGVVEIGTGPEAEHNGDAGHNRDQQTGARPERGDARLCVSGRKRVVHLSRVHAELVSDPMPSGIHLGRVWMSHVFLFNAR